MYLIKLMMWIVLGACMLGGQCASDVKDSLVAAGLNFVEDSAVTVLETVMPVEDFLGWRTRLKRLEAIYSESQQ